MVLEGNVYGRRLYNKIGAKEEGVMREAVFRGGKYHNYIVMSMLKREFQDTITQEQRWWFDGVPKGVRKKVDDRVNEEGGKKGGREENLDLIDYREIIVSNFTLFEDNMGQGKGTTR